MIGPHNSKGLIVAVKHVHVVGIEEHVGVDPNPFVEPVGKGVGRYQAVGHVDRQTAGEFEVPSSSSLSASMVPPTGMKLTVGYVDYLEPFSRSDSPTSSRIRLGSDLAWSRRLTASQRNGIAQVHHFVPGFDAVVGRIEKPKNLLY